MPKKCSIAISNGSLKIGAIPIAGRRDAQGRLWVAEMDGYARQKIPVCGVYMPARVVIKVFCEPKSPRERMAVEILHREKKRVKREKR